MRLSKLLGVVSLGAALCSTAVAGAAEEEKKGEEKKAEGEHKEGGKAEGGHKEGGHEEGHHGNERLPIALAERPLTLPKMILNPEAELAIEREGVPSLYETGLGLAIGAHFGITDDLEVGAVVLPLHLTFKGGAADKTSFAYGSPLLEQPISAGNPQVEGTYRFLKGEFELGARLNITVFPGREGIKTGAVITPGVPALARFGKSARLDFGLFIPIVVPPAIDLPGAPAPKPTAGMYVPVRFIYDIIEEVHVGARTGFQIRNFKEAKDSIAVPLGILAGYAIKGEKGPLIDIDPFFTWPQLADTALGPSMGKANAGAFEAGVSVGGFLYF